MRKKARVSVILPRNACKEIRVRMLQEGYSLREKSKWYGEAIDLFLESPNYAEYVEMAALVEDKTQAETIYISKELQEKLEESIIDIRQKIPLLDGVKSLIVRASIIQRLLLPISSPSVRLPNNA